MSKKRNDFKVYPYTASSKPGIEQWQVKSGSIDVYLASSSKVEADRVAAALNIDPYYLERGNTQKDRANGQSPITKDTYK